MYILDTDHLSLIQRNGQEGKRILGRLAAVVEIEVAVTVITYEEQVKGRLALLSKAKTLDEQVSAYQGLQQLAIDYRLIVIVCFSQAAALEHQSLRKAYPRLGNMDLKIAAIAPKILDVMTHMASRPSTCSAKRHLRLPKTIFSSVSSITLNPAFPIYEDCCYLLTRKI